MNRSGSAATPHRPGPEGSGLLHGDGEGSGEGETEPGSEWQRREEPTERSSPGGRARSLGTRTTVSSGLRTGPVAWRLYDVRPI